MRRDNDLRKKSKRVQKKELTCSAIYRKEKNFKSML